jgi:hypothetical protein
MFADSPIRIVSEKEIISAGFTFAMLRNLNSPDDFQEAERKWLG